MKSSLLAALLVLSTGCFNQEVGDVKVTIENKIQGENGKDIKFAIFGAAEANGRVSLVLIASKQPDLCAEIGDAATLIDDIGTGQEPGDFILTTVLVDGVLGAGERFDGDQQADQIVDPKFIVGDGAGLVVEAVDQDAEGTLNLTAFNGQTLVGTIEANLNKELSGIINDDLNEPLAVEILLATECPALSSFAQTQL
jgi:hypothetical protein